MSGKKHGIIFKTVRVILLIVLAVILLLVGMLGFLSITEYKPQERETLEITGEATRKLNFGDDLSLLSFNIGYAALGDNADFFMDGGSGVMTADEARVNENLDGIINEVKKVNPDIVFFQEADKNSTRSHYINEYDRLREVLNGYSFSFANNFKVAFLPYPIPPIGKVDSGIVTASSFGVISAERVQLPIPFSWPMRMANLKRCVLVSRIPVENSDKELVLFNLHLEAYDNGEGKEAQTKMLTELLAAEIKKGNFVIAGGDFNQIFSNVDKSAYPTYEGMWTPGEIDVSAFGSMNSFMDNKTPTCRSLDKPYKDADKNNFQYYLIDGFVVSENISVQSVETQDLGFVYSDHNPVLLKIKLEPNYVYYE